MNIDEIPTPETDAAFKQWLLESDKSHRIRMRSKMRDLERRLTVAREALQAVSDAGGNYCDLLTSQEIAEKALEQTAPKQ